MAAFASSIQQASVTATRDAPRDDERRHEREIETLREEVNHLRREKNEAEEVAIRANDKNEEREREANEQKARTKYLEYKVEFFRRELIAMKRDRSPTGELDKLKGVSQAELLRHLAETEGTTNTMPSKSLKDRIGEAQTVGTLAERVGRPRGRGTKHAYVPKLNQDIPVRPLAFENHYIPMVNDKDQPIIPVKPMHRFRLLYGIAIDMSKDLPEAKPTTKMTNPLTGRPWTPQELSEYPRGVPGWSNEVEGVTTTNAPVNHIDEGRLRAMDKSLLTVGLTRITDDPTVFPWRFPATPAEVTHLREIAERPGNLQALEFWEHYRRECVETPSTSRNALQNIVARTGYQRPSWAPYRQHEGEFTESPDLTATPGSTEASDNGSTTMNADADPKLMCFGSLDVSGEPLHGDGEGHMGDVEMIDEQEELRAGTENLMTWVRYLNQHPEIDVPGVCRGEDGMVTHYSTVRGMLRIARLGCDSEDGQVTIHFIREVATYLRNTPYHYRPSQFLSATPISKLRDMTSQRIQEYMKNLGDYVMDAPIEMEDDGEDLVGISDWLAIVAPMEDPPVTGDEEELDYGVDPNLYM